MEVVGGSGEGVDRGEEEDDVVAGLEEAPAVPAAALLNLTYPYNPSAELPQRSSGYPGQATLQSPVETWFAGI